MYRMQQHCKLCELRRLGNVFHSSVLLGIHSRAVVSILLVSCTTSLGYITVIIYISSQFCKFINF